MDNFCSSLKKGKKNQIQIHDKGHTVSTFTVV